MDKEEDFTDRVRRGAAEAGEQARSRLEELLQGDNAEKLRSAAEEMGADAAGFVRRYPLPSVAGAFLAGLLLGSMFLRRER